MAQQVDTFIENNFTKGLITESTGLNFPENAATATDNCTYTLIGDVTRREGINFEKNFSETISFGTNQAKSIYKWNNAGGSGSIQLVVEQVGSFLYFFKSSTATTSSPLSNQILSSVVNISTFSVGTFDPTIECQFTDGNGYLFVFHPGCEPFYCTYNAATSLVVGNSITIQTRDFVGVVDNLADLTRPLTLSNQHSYNLQNQGWTSGGAWTDTLTSPANQGIINIGNAISFTITSAVQPIVLGNTLLISWSFVNAAGFHGVSNTYVLVTSYVGTTVSGTVISHSDNYGGTTFWTTTSFPGTPFPVVTPVGIGYIDAWKTAIGNYPSNADVWWYYKNASGAFSPSTTISNITISNAPAPKGHFILQTFNRDYSAVSGVSGLTAVTTTKRPKTGCWFQGRVWYSGVEAQQVAQGDALYYTWTENIYFSQIITTPNDFGNCFQKNDPTSETLFDLLPTDGGVITIQGCGSIYKLFPLVNALIVFAANGVWYITGSAGIGFTANDYTIVKLSSVQSISSTSFVDVQGLPIFWNEEGIYKVEPAKQGTSLLNSPLHVQPLEVNPITIGTILSFYNQIPLASKKYAKGAYHPIDYVVQWVYRDTDETDITSRYSYNKILNYNVHNAAFFPYTIDNSNTSVNGIVYVAGPGGSNSPVPVFKYPCSTPSGGNFLISFAEENDPTCVDWGNKNYISYFITGYKLRGQAIKKFQPQYLQIYTRLNDEVNSYKIQSIWDYANDRNSGRWSSLQQVNHGVSHYDTVHKRIKLRGNGYALQFKVTSTDGMPFDIQGWVVADTINAGT